MPPHPNTEDDEDDDDGLWEKPAWAKGALWYREIQEEGFSKKSLLDAVDGENAEYGLRKYG